MSGVTKVTLVTRPEQLSKVEAGPISIIMGANLRKSSKAISLEKQNTVKKEKPMLFSNRKEAVKHFNRPKVTLQLEDENGEPFEAEQYIDDLTPEERACVHPDDRPVLQKYLAQQSQEDRKEKENG